MSNVVELFGQSAAKAGVNWPKIVMEQQCFYTNKKLVLVVQDKLLNYMGREFNFGHLRSPASIGDSMHLHSYRMDIQADMSYKLAMHSRLSIDADRIGLCLGLQAEARIELAQIILALQAKISQATLFVPM